MKAELKGSEEPLPNTSSDQLDQKSTTTSSTTSSEAPPPVPTLDEKLTYVASSSPDTSGVPLDEGRVLASESYVGDDEVIPKTKCISFTLKLQRFATCITTVFDGNDGAINTRSLISARFLMSLFFMDKVAWVVSKMIHYDALRVAEEVKDLGMSVLFLSLLLEVIETTAEFVATSCTPFLYKCTYARRSKYPLNARGLANFALLAYCFSSVIALIIYPSIGVYVWTMDNKTAATVVFVTVVRTIQYSVLNQIGDASLELSKPHWLSVFSKTTFSTPGIDSKCTLRAKSSADIVSAHITFITLTWVPFLSIPYLAAKSKDNLRVMAIFFLALVNVVFAFAFACQMKFISSGIDEDVVEEDHETAGNLIPLWKLHGYEIALVVLVVCVKAVLQQSIGAIKLVAFLSLPSTMAAGFAGAAPLGAFAYLYYTIRKQRNLADRTKNKEEELVKQICKEITSKTHTRVDSSFNDCFQRSDIIELLKSKNVEHTEDSAKREIDELVTRGLLIVKFEHGDDILYECKNVHVRTPYHVRLRFWIKLLFVIGLSLGISSVFLLQGSGPSLLVVFCAIFASLPAIVGQQMFDIDFDAFMMEYEANHHDEVTSMQYYTMILSVIINGPLLATNFLTLSKYESEAKDDEPSEKAIQIQAAIVLITALCIFMILCFYYAFVDRFLLPKQGSIYKTFAAGIPRDEVIITTREEKKPDAVQDA